MKPAFESKPAARRIFACAAVALVAAAPAAWAQNSQRPDEGTGAPILSPPDTSAQGSGGMSNGNTAAPTPATRMQEPRGTAHGRPHVRTKPGGPSAAGAGGSGSTGGAAGGGAGGAGTGTGATGNGSAAMGGVGAGQGGTGAGAGNGRSPGATGSGGGGAGGTGSAGSSGY